MEPEIESYVGAWGILTTVMLIGLCMDATTSLSPFSWRRRLTWLAAFILVPAGIAFRYYIELKWS